jgi:hypothetical protein
VLAENGYTLGKIALRKHLEGKCSCGIKWRTSSRPTR